MNELQTLSPLIAGIGNVNVFTVPAGYFDEFSGNILTGLSTASNNLLDAASGPVSMQVPAGYFDTLADTILSRIKAEGDARNELKELSALLYSIPNNNVFTVPQGYFEGLAGAVLNKIAVADAARAELEQLSPLLYKIPVTNVFTVPQGYFEALAPAITGTLKPQPAKLVVMQKRTSTILKYAVAAVFTGLMALGVFKFTSNDTSAKNSLTTAQVEGLKIAKENRFEEELAKVGNEEIANFLTKDGVDVDAAVAVAEIESKADKNETATDKTESNEIDELIDQLDDDTKMN